MEWNLMAVAAFVLFFIYDWNSIHRKNRVVQRFFGLGTAVLAVSAVGCLIQQKEKYHMGSLADCCFSGCFSAGCGIAGLYFIFCDSI